MNEAVVRPGGLHAIFIRSALSAMRVCEQTVTDLGWNQNYIHWCSERQRKEIKGWLDRRGAVKWMINHPWGVTGTGEEPSPPPMKKAEVEVDITIYTICAGRLIVAKKNLALVLWIMGSRCQIIWKVSFMLDPGGFPLLIFPFRLFIKRIWSSSYLL